jgi:CHAT domain-containing protein/Tfp pilus assembly protein PilF
LERSVGKLQLIKSGGDPVKDSQHGRPHWFLLVASVCFLFVPVQAQDQTGKTRGDEPLALEKSAFIGLAQQLYAAYEQKDPDGFLRLWSLKSPDLGDRRLATQKLFAEYEKIEIKNLSARRLTINGDSANLRVEFMMAAVETKTGKAAAIFGPMRQSLDYIKEAGEWKLWRERPLVEEFTDTYVNAKSDAHRSQLLTEEKDLVDGKLMQHLMNRGVRYQQLADYPGAMTVYSLLQTVAENIGEPAGVGVSYNGRGNVNSTLGNFVEALAFYRKALAIAEQLRLEGRIASTLNNIGLTQSYQGDYDSAMEYLQKSLELSEKLNNQLEIARTLANISRIHRDRGAYGAALESLQKSLKLVEKTENQELIAYTLSILGSIYLRQGDKNLAFENYRKSLAIRKASGYKYGAAISEFRIGEMYYIQGEYSSALEYLQRARVQLESIEEKMASADVDNLIGAVYRGQGDYKLAIEYHQKAIAQLEVSDEKGGLTMALIDLGSAHLASRQPAAALEAADRATTLARQVGGPELLWMSRELAGNALLSLDQPGPAQRAFEEAITTIEELRWRVSGAEQQQQRYFESKVSPYHAMVGLLVKQNQNAEAFAYAERAKARALVDVLYSGRINITKAMTPAELEQERGLKNQMVSLNTQISKQNSGPRPDAARINELRSQLQKARLDFEGFQTSLYASHPELKAQRGETEFLTPEQAHSLLPGGIGVLLEYVVTDARTYLFALRRKPGENGIELKVYPIEIQRKDLESRVAGFREILAQGSPGFRQPARDLYDLLIKPAAAQVQGGKALVIVPDGVLWELPFQALLQDRTRWLIADFALAYAPSLTALREMNKLRSEKKRSAGAPTLLAFGNPSLGRQTIDRSKSGSPTLPTLMDEKLSPLPEAERQVNALKRIYGPANSRVYIGAEAREDRAKSEAAGYRILHLATHGILNNRSPMYSHILLAQTESETKEDGLLEAGEIMRMELAADLVTLSACETARGRVGEGEGMIGLSWALFVAGCPTAVVSQWKVDSAGTTELMLEFHRQLKAQMQRPQKTLSAAYALRAAALKLQRTKDYRHPFYWAGFVAAGKGF